MKRFDGNPDDYDYEQPQAPLTEVQTLQRQLESLKIDLYCHSNQQRGIQKAAQKLGRAIQLLAKSPGTTYHTRRT